MFKENLLNRETIIWSTGLALLLIFLLDYILIGILFMLLLSSVLFYKERAVVFISITAFLVIVSDIDQRIRIAVNILCIFSLLFVFLKNYGFSYSLYPKLPKELVSFFLLFYLSMIFSALFSDYTFDGIQQIVQTTIFFVIVYILYSFIRQKSDIYVVVGALLLSALIIIISVIFEFIAGNYSFIDLLAHAQIRTTGILSNVNAPGGIAIAVLPLMIGFMFYRNFNKRGLTLLSIFIILFGILLTTSRSAVLGIFFSLCFMLWYFYRARFLKYFSFFILSLVILYFIPSVNNAVNLLFRIESGMSQRGHLWEISLNMIRDNPVFGIGPGAYSHVMLNYLPVMFDTFVGKELITLRELTIGSNNSHNFFLYYFSDMGILGLISSLVLPCVFFNLCFKTIRMYKNEDSIFFYLTVGIAAAGIGLFLRGIFEGIGILTYGWIKVDLPFWILFALLVFLYQNKIKDLPVFFYNKGH